MCQLTLLHGETKFVKAMLGNLTLVNSTGNKDGHGIFFPEPIKKIYKTEEAGSDKIYEDSYWKMIEKCIGDTEETFLISHVRSASQTQKVINVDNAHPHQAGNIILMHNGTLEPEDDKLEVEGRIDSYWFTKRLAEICGRKYLKPEHIAQTMKEFRGKFAFLIADLRQPKIVYISRGRMADLGYTNYYDAEGNNLCFAVNTMKKNLGTVGLPMFWRAITGQKIYMDDPKELDSESIYIYDIPQGTLVKTKQKIEERSIFTKTSTTGNRNRTSGYRPHNRHGTEWDSPNHGVVNISAAESDKTVFSVAEYAVKMKLSFSELNHIYFLMYGHSVLFADIEEMKALDEFLEKLYKTYKGQGKGKKENVWRQIRALYSKRTDTPIFLEIYRIADKARFPWFFNANSGLKKHVRPSVQKWDSDGQKTSP
jgi:predicted glutamine amidotransferase